MLPAHADFNEVIMQQAGQVKHLQACDKAAVAMMAASKAAADEACAKYAISSSHCPCVPFKP